MVLDKQRNPGRVREAAQIFGDRRLQRPGLLRQPGDPDLFPGSADDRRPDRASPGDGEPENKPVKAAGAFKDREAERPLSLFPSKPGCIRSATPL